MGANFKLPQIQQLGVEGSSLLFGGQLVVRFAVAINTANLRGVIRVMLLYQCKKSSFAELTL